MRLFWLKFGAVFLALVLTAAACSSRSTNNAPAPPSNVNGTVPANANVNAPGGAGSGSAGNVNVDIGATTTPTTLVGKVFVKGYNSPSASYGLLATDGREIGFGAYDSMKEQFRPYVGDRVTVTFSAICKTSMIKCCRTLFSLCGTVSAWKPMPALAP